MQFHDRLYEARKRSGMTQSDLAEKLGVSRQAVSRWEMGTAKPEFENLIAISDLLGVSTDYLLKGSDKAEDEAGVDTHTEDPQPGSDTWNIWDKLLLWSIVLFAALTIIFGLAAFDIMTGIVTAAFLMGLLAILIGIVALITWIVREILKKAN